MSFKVCCLCDCALEKSPSSGIRPLEQTMMSRHASSSTMLSSDHGFSGISGVLSMAIITKPG
jgi:hypothetical protein